jgi:hypothetical protein
LVAAGSIRLEPANVKQAVDEFEEKIALFESITMSMCERHLGLFYKLPDGTEVDTNGIKDWLLERGVDILSCEWMWWYDYLDAYNHCAEPDADMKHEDFERRLAELFEDDDN